jgi:CrcB protein
MKIILAIGIGSFIGGILRYLLSLFIQNKFLSAFPFGTMSVNILGCFLIGLVFGLSDRGNISMEARLFLATGFLGGFTTFSAFSNETVGK